MVMILKWTWEFITRSRFNPIRLASSYMYTSDKVIIRFRIRLIESGENSFRFTL